MADPDHLYLRKGPTLCGRCNCIYDKVFLYVEPVFAFPGDGDNLQLQALATMQVSPCCGNIQPAPIDPRRVIALLEHMKDCPHHDD